MAAIASEYLADMLEPEKFAAAIFGVTLAFTVLSANTVGFRTWFRLRNKQFGNDDYLMCTALVSLTGLLKCRNAGGENTCILISNSIGGQLGAQCHSDARDVRWNRVTRFQTQHGTGSRRQEGPSSIPLVYPFVSPLRPLADPLLQYLFLWQIFYTISLVFIKTSILTTLKRIDKERRFIYIVWGLIVVVSLLSVAGIITLLAKCRPITSNWTGNGSCIASHDFVALSKTAYAFDVASDLAMATISTLLLWSPDMKLRSKIMTGLVLGLGVV